ncbi:uncharacterized protein LOC119075470 [Bradysia coprophila]|uniref:uncharacterized protein LOC119075470 n=1 Tax=Bradysia coprophila TaxID=38358 RepID=UPI00187D75E6|nr:uncharacterized protein LOC119075470 [Bradysia coprophila]
MKLLKLFLVFGLLCQTLGEEVKQEFDGTVSFSVEKVWLSYRHCACSCEEDPWRKGVQDFYDGCRAASKSFSGKAFEVADSTLDSIAQVITKLIEFTDSNSTILQSSSTNMLESISRNNRLNGTSLNIAIEFEKVFPIEVKEFNDVAKKLSEHIGELTCSFTNAVSDFGAELSKFMREFLQSCRLFNCKKRVDFKCVLKKYQKLTNIIALIDDTLLNKCDGEVTQDAYDSILVFHLIYLYMGLSVTGINSCVLDVLHDRKCYVSESVKFCSLSFEYAIVQVVQAVSGVVTSSIDSIKGLLKVFVDIAATLNAVVKGVLGLSNDVLLSVGDIVKNLVSGGKAQTSILKGII